MSSTKLEEIQILFQVRNARKRGPTSSDEFNDMIEEIASDSATLNDQWNNRLVPLTSAIPDGTDDTDVDAYANGLDGGNLYIDQDASASYNSTYFNSPADRPNTILEQFDAVYSTVNEIRDDLENGINNFSISASQISIVDAAGIYTSTNVEAALAEVMGEVDALSALSFGSVREHILPHSDDTYNIGSTTKRWSSIYLAPTSLHIYATSGEGGGSIRDFTLGVDSSDGAFLIKENTTTLFRALPAGGIQIPELASAPSNKTGFGTIYTLTSDNKLYFKDSSGVITDVVGGTTQANILALAADSNNDEASSMITMSVDGSEKVRLDSTGRLGIGVTPSGTPLLQVAGAVTIDGNLTMGDSGGTNLTIDGEAGNWRSLRFMSSGVLRWLLNTDNTAEGGSNAGSDLYLKRYSDAGSLLANVLQITRSDGTIKVGASTSPSVFYSDGKVGIGSGYSTHSYKLHIIDTVANTAAIERHITGDYPCEFSLMRSRGSITTGVVTPAALVDDDRISEIGFYGHDGSGWIKSAMILAEVDGTVATDYMPGRLTFHTWNDSDEQMYEWMRIDQNGNIIADRMQQYISVTLTVDNNAQGNEFNPFDTTTNGGTASTLASQGITYSSATGKFTVAYTGTYKVDIVTIMEQSANGALDIFKVRKNDSSDILDASGTYINAAGDPLERSLSFIVDLAASDYLELKLDSTGAATLACHNGTTFNMIRIK